MPVMDGIESTKEIRKIQKKHPYIVALTANALEGDRDKFLSLGMDEYLSKPLKIDLLKSILKDVST